MDKNFEHRLEHSLENFLNNTECIVERRGVMEKTSIKDALMKTVHAHYSHNYSTMKISFMLANGRYFKKKNIIKKK